MTAAALLIAVALGALSVRGCRERALIVGAGQGLSAALAVATRARVANVAASNTIAV